MGRNRHRVYFWQMAYGTVCPSALIGISGWRTKFIRYIAGENSFEWGSTGQAGLNTYGSRLATARLHTMPMKLSSRLAAYFWLAALQLRRFSRTLRRWFTAQVAYPHTHHGDKPA